MWEDQNLLEDGLLQIGIAKEKIPSLAANIEKYINEIILFNSAYNLTNTSDHDELVIRHIFDSLAPYREFCRIFQTSLFNANPTENQKQGSETGIDSGGEKLSENDFLFSTAGKFSVGDIGSGGGLPGIPLAIVFPEIDFTLVERMTKRCAFLENVAAVLGLKNVTVLCSEAEKLPKGKFNLITFRAFRPLDAKMTKTLLGITKTGGCLAAYKAKKSSIKEEMDGIKSLVPSYEVIPLAVPYLADSERNLVLVRK